MVYNRSSLMEKRLAKNREIILLAARKLIAQGGFKEAAIAAVAAEAGISTGMIYRYFPSKADLFIEILTDAVNREVKILSHAANFPGSAQERLCAAVTAFVRRALAGPNLAYAFIIEPVEPEVDAERIRCRRMFGGVFRLILLDGIKKGELPSQNVDVSAACVVGAFTEALVGPMRSTTRNAQDKEKLIKSINTFCSNAVSAVDH